MSSKLDQRLLVLQEKARHTSEGPGVYRMLDKDAKILYIGKAKSLQNRVRTYFQQNLDDQKTRVLVGKVHDFDVILTNSEAEALILESLLIKKHKPRYNILLKDDRSYPYVMIDENHTYPKLVYARRPRKKPKIRLYGPFASSQALRAALRSINRSFRLRDCTDVEFANRSRPCINYQIGICSAPCTGLITPDAYRADVKKAVEVLKGHGDEVLRQLEDDMERFSKAQEYEEAAKVRDQHSFLEKTVSRRRDGRTVERGAADGANRDVIGWYRKPGAASVAILFVRHGNLVDSASFHFDDLEGREDGEVLAQFLAQFYLTDDRFEVTEEIPRGNFSFPGAEAKTFPDEILLPFPVPETALLSQSLRELGHTLEIHVPQKGAKQEILALATKNASHAFEEWQREKGSVYRVLSDLKARLRLENYPRRIECFDISNLGDTGIVASRVTFIEGKPDKALYRHYKIRSTQTQNDFASMREVIERRLIKTLDKEHFEEPPDLLMIDGGKGQLAMAVEVMKELNITGVDLVALAKARTISEEEKAASEKAGRELDKAFERIFKPGRLNPINLPPDSPVCHLVQRIRDEAHRFAVEFQRKQRTV